MNRSGRYVFEDAAPVLPGANDRSRPARGRAAPVQDGGGEAGPLGRMHVVTARTARRAAQARPIADDLVTRLNSGPALLRFMIISGTGTLVDLCTMWIDVALLGLPILPAKAVATEVAVVNNFIWNNRWTFRHDAEARPLPRRFVAFNLTYVGSLIVVLLAMAEMVHLWGNAHYLLYNVATIPFSLTWNYSFSRFMIWRRRAVGTAIQPRRVANAVAMAGGRTFAPQDRAVCLYSGGSEPAYDESGPSDYA